MQHKHIYWRFFAVHILTGWAFALLLSLGVTYLLAAANPFLLMMAAAVPVLDFVVSKKRMRLLSEDDPSLPANRIFVLSVAGFGLGILVNLLIVSAVF